MKSIIFILSISFSISAYAQSCWQCKHGCGDRTLEICGDGKPWWILPDGTSVFVPKKPISIIEKLNPCIEKDNFIYCPVIAIPERIVK